MPCRRLIIAKEVIIRQDILSGDSRRFQECSIFQEIGIIKRSMPGRGLIIARSLLFARRFKEFSEVFGIPGDRDHQAWDAWQETYYSQGF